MGRAPYLSVPLAAHGENWASGPRRTRALICIFCRGSPKETADVMRGEGVQLWGTCPKTPIFSYPLFAGYPYKMGAGEL